VPGGGVALLNASQKISAKTVGEKILMEAIKSPYNVILDNAGISGDKRIEQDGFGIDVISGVCVDMVNFGIIDPVLVTKSALKNAVSVVNTIISADCVISNIRVNESN
jgi:chaperonin GroEL